MGLYDTLGRWLGLA